MAQPPKQFDGSGAMGFFNTMPSWLKALVMVLVAPFLALAMAGVFLQVNVNEYLDKYMDIQLEAMKENSTGSADRIIFELGGRMDAIELQLQNASTATVEVEGRVVVIEGKVETIEKWACGHADAQSLKLDRPTFCDGGTEP